MVQMCGCVGWLAGLPLGSTAAGATLPAAPTPSMFDPVGEPAAVILDITWLLIGICGAIGLIMLCLIGFAVLRCRRKEGDHREPAQVYGSNPIELAWTVVPLMIVFVLFMVSARGIFDLEKTSPPEGSLEVTVTGHRWWWEFDYEGLGIVTAGELHVPIDDDGPADLYLTLKSADVAHSFWVPQFGGKMDVIPDRVNHLWLQVDRPGVFVGQCAEYCGNQHANMLITVIVEPRAEFDAWVAAQQREAVEDPAVAAGKRLFLRTSCINCHTVRGTVANGTFAPDLTHLMSRSTIGSGVVPNTPENLREWVWDPQLVKPGCEMPSMKLSRDEVDLVCSWLETLK
ncbi:MAG: cytochrome c oxidase subunit II [Phycisphaerales bacterium]|nr:cytochrome c oxidase subunit II [Phycisphaerales bacterium]